MKYYYIYILSTENNKVLYIGVTNNLVKRLIEHRKTDNNYFTSKYEVKKLVYFERTKYILNAIKREKQLKNWHREWKNNLISKNNPLWENLDPEINSG